MNEQKLTIDEAKDLLDKGFGTIYTKDEVKSLLDRIKKESYDLHRVLEEIMCDFEYQIRNFDKDDVIDVDSASFCIESCNTLILDDVDINLSSIENALKEVLEEIKNKY
jgi:hypothetical protein